jgi:hypothetical protein
MSQYMVSMNLLRADPLLDIEGASKNCRTPARKPKEASYPNRRRWLSLLIL